MDSRYHISELFRLAFGVQSPIFITESFDKKKPAVIDFKGISLLKDYHESKEMSEMGTPIIDTLKFKGGNYNLYNHSGELVSIAFEDYFLPPTTLFMFRRAKNITKTNLLGSNGTVKEIFGFDDWVIDVKGFFLDDTDSSAIEKAKQLHEWIHIAGGIDVRGNVLTRKEIFAVVIEDYRQDTLQGMPGIIPFSMTLLSDEAVELM